MAAGQLESGNARYGHREATGRRWGTVCTRLAVIALALVAEHGHCQSFHYTEQGVASCPAAPTPTTASPKAVSRGVPHAGRINVTCGFDQGSYTVTLNSTDADATFSPRTHIVNFGRIVGNGNFAVTFSTVGVQSVSASITSNMGSPTVRGRFVSPANDFNVVIP